MENNETPTTTLNANQLRLIWFYLPIIVIVVQGYVNYQLATKVSELQEKLINYNKDDKEFWRNAYYRTNEIVERNAIQGRAIRDTM